MASKILRGKLKAAKAVETGPLKLWVAANQADPGPPLGPQIGQRGVNIAVFCRDFNDKTKLYRQGKLDDCSSGESDLKITDSLICLMQAYQCHVF